MTWSPDASITGGAQTGFTSPTYSQVDDLPPVVNSKQKTVTALGGTQTGATANSAASPFTSTFYKPTTLRALPQPNPLTGKYGAIPMNQYKHIIRKGGLVAAGVYATAVCRITWDIPAGMEAYSPAEILALTSYVVGQLNEESADLGETLVSGVV